MSTIISAVIIDDQQQAVDDLLYLIKKGELPVKILATANSGKDGLVAILKHKPQLVFLDVVMPEMSGFEMLDLLPTLEFGLIITTSDDKHAIQAIRSSALDFLLKPIKSSELKEAVDRSLLQRELPSKTQLTMLEKIMKENTQSITKIALTISDGVELVNLDEIMYFESDDNYTIVHMKNGKKNLISKTLGKFEEMVGNSHFFRVHHSFLVNLYQINKFIKKDGGYIILENGTTINVARNRRDDFLEALAKI